MEDFQVALENCESTDLGFIGHKFTWTNRRPSSAYTKQQLDRATANRGWTKKFLASSVSHLFSHAFDHIPILLTTMSDRRLRGKGLVVSNLRSAGCYGMIVRRLCLRRGQKEGMVAQV